MRVYLTNLGCKLNQAELEALARRLHADGHTVVPSLAGADLQIVNSCTVTHVAARTSRKVARQGARRNAAIRTVLTGCYVSGDPEEAAALAGVDLVVPNEDKNDLLALVYERFPEWRPRREPSEVPVPYVPLAFGNSRALIKIEDGCNMRCSFCIIPMTRGSQTSRSLPEVLEEARELVEAGHREVVITGVQISSYRWREIRLYEMVRSVLERTDVERVRLTSIAPWDFDSRLVDLFDDGRICRHFHLSLQSGCDRTLQAMRRPYTADQYQRLTQTLRERIPGLAITTDVIVGFPGESEEDFQISLEFVRDTGFARVHAFPYSRRPGTAADDLPDQIDPGTIRERMQRMLEVSERSRRQFERSQIGQTVPVLWETRGDQRWKGTSDNYLHVEASDALATPGEITPATIESLNDRGVVAARAIALGTRVAEPSIRRPHPAAV